MKRFLLAVACLTAQDLLNARCDTACKLGGWAEGYERRGYCICSDLIPVDRMLGKLPQLPARAAKNRLSTKSLYNYSTDD